MQMIRIIFLAISIGLSFITNAQFIITGTVMDSTTREPLPKASVFCQNTTIVTVTDKQVEFSLSLKSGGYDLIFSYM